MRNFLVGIAALLLLASGGMLASADKRPAGVSDTDSSQERGNAVDGDDFGTRLQPRVRVRTAMRIFAI
jgi:hypothetical protein